MDKLPRVTDRETMSVVLAAGGPQGGERMIEYSIFLTDAFTGGGSSISFYEAPGAPNQLDGFENDDSYRRSRHLLNRHTITDNLVNQNNVRESSLARQLQEKKEQPATIRLIRRRKPEEMGKDDARDGHLPWKNLIPPNTKFFLESVQENREEKVQVIDTFGEWIAFFFGRKPEVYSYSGRLLNSKNHNWKSEFQENYEHFLRGTQAVRSKATVFMQYDDVMVEGYILNSSISQSALANNEVPFSFNMLVINRSPLDPRALIGMRILRSGGTAAELELFQDLQGALDLSRTGSASDLETFLLMREYFSGHYSPGAGTSINRSESPFPPDPGTSKAPGATGGTNNEQPESSFFDSITTTKLEGSGQSFSSDILGDL